MRIDFKNDRGGGKWRERVSARWISKRYIFFEYCSWKVGLSTGRLAWDSIAGVIED